MPITVRPTKPDIAIARVISRNTAPPTERAASILTWAADEHVLVTALAASVSRICSNRYSTMSGQIGSPSFGICTAFQPPAGRRTHFRPDTQFRSAPSVPRRASFPRARIIRALSACLISTRVLLLAHWASDVIVGSAIEVVLERLIRCATGYGAGESV
ncbi:hypothetical protein [Bradyrhizobium embrapense]|uniref:hypothetical protein n=1 Tax=Bradyrhizobium embrapense TaxID=630921 RepID=UPI003221F7E9